MKKPLPTLILIFVTAAVATTVLAANYPLEIIQPQEGLDSRNRFYKAYPGLEYNVRMAVIGGAYPFTYSLVTAPAGMTINQNTGEIDWPNPATSGSPHSVTVQVRDSEGTTASVSWTITVTTSGWLFVDAVNGHNSPTGTGTIGNPFKDFTDIFEGTDYAAKYATTYQNYFVYFRTGTYYMDGFFSGDIGIQWITATKPNVWLGYPGETATISFANHDVFFYEASSPGFYIDNFNIVLGGQTHAITYESGQSNCVFRRLNFSGMGHGISGTNPSLMFQARAETPGSGKYHVIQDCTYTDPGNAVDENGYFFLMYTSDRTLFEDNNYSDMTWIGIGPKDSVSYVFMRNNRGLACPSSAMAGLLGDDTGYPTRDIEISYNLFKSTGNSDIVALDYDSHSGTIGKIYFFRNTLIGMVNVNNVGSNKGPYYFYNNVIINTYTSDPDHIYVHNSAAPERVIRANNLFGTPADGIVDTNGDLTPSYSAYLGTHGYQITGSSGPDITPPSLSNPQPTGTLPAGTTQTTLSLQTNEAAACRYSTTPGVSYSSMTSTFSTTGGTSHSTTISGLQNGQTYNYYVRCQDTANNSNTNDFLISFSVASINPPTISVDSTYSGYSASVIDDGIIDAYGGTSTTWASDENSTLPHWITVNFTNPIQINFVNIWWAYNSQQSKLMTSQRVDVQYWNGSAYQTAASLLYPGSDVANSSSSFSAVTTNSLRFFQPANMGNPSYSTVLWITELDYGFCHKSDTNCNSCVEMSELNAFIDRWKINNLDVTIRELIEAIGLWKREC